MQNRKGFTLIELLVVIAIIGILSAVGLIALNGAREKARDSQRKSDLGQIRTGMALYYDSQNQYPNSVAGSAAGGDHTADATEPADLVVGGVTLTSTVRADALVGTNGGSTIGDLVFDTMVANTATKYISRLPNAPTGGSDANMAKYFYKSCGSTNVEDYAVFGLLERPATANYWWVVDASSGTAQERQFAANFCSGT